MTHPLVAAVEQFPDGSCAPAVVAYIYQIEDLTRTAKRVLAVTFLAAYEANL